MRQDQTADDHELRGIVDEKITALIRELEEANYSAAKVAAAIDDVLREKWLAPAEALRAARESLPKNFVSDGNEG